jgi:molybdate/tungstate transport system substrate-binding protein
MKEMILKAFLLVQLIILYSCTGSMKKVEIDEITGTIKILHAGSLSMPMKVIADSFMLHYPKVKVLLEASGSVDGARKISELNRNFDIFASADYLVIDRLLIPSHAKWNLIFAGNEMVVAYTPASKESNSIDSLNWFDIIEKKDIFYGRSDPDSDPCGYRTLLTLNLAEEYYGKSGLAKNILEKDVRFIRPKEVDLLALLQTQAIDYIFIYRSIAIQHKLKYVELPKSINLGYPGYAENYKRAKVYIRGSSPKTTIEIVGEPMAYSFTIPTNAENYDLAILFANFMTDKKLGLSILESMGMAIFEPRLSPLTEEKPDLLILNTLPSH